MKEKNVIFINSTSNRIRHNGQNEMRNFIVKTNMH